MIPSSVYQQRRQRLASSVKADCIVISANHMLQKSTSVAYEFFQDSHFYYYTGISQPGWVLVIDTFKGREWLIKPKGSDYLSIFDGEVSDEEISNLSDITDIRVHRDGWHDISEIAKQRTAIGTFVPKAKYSKTYGMFLNPTRHAIIDKIKRYNTKLNLVDITTESARLRTVKDEHEIALLKEAIHITGDALHIVKAGMQSMASEAEIHAEITKHFLSNNSHHGFTPIVASGSNATVLHYTANNQALAPNSFVVMDIGAEHHKYNADITRAYAYGTPTARQKEIFEAVYTIQQLAYDELKPGVTIREYEAIIEQYMGEALNQLGIISTMLRKDIRRYYPTATSHYLGLDVHDSGDYELPLEPGVVLTVEPGIYVPEEGIGIRIEDDVVITDQGIDILSADIAL